MGRWLQKTKLYHKIICMRFRPILVFDSGIGGLSTLCSLKEEMPNEDFVYVADFLNSPYGNKTKREIEKVVTLSLKRCVEKFKPKCVVVACNTATAVCINHLRKSFFIPVFGCEPAVKMAKKSGKQKILVLCTRATKKYSRFLKEFDDITIFSPNKLAGMIDDNFFARDQIVSYLQKSLKNFENKFDAVVLGCTHYCLFKKDIENILGCPSFEGNKSIAVFVKSAIDSKSKKKGKIFLFSTDPQKQQYLEKCHKMKKGEKICVE